jgi:hypothetical protein
MLSLATLPLAAQTPTPTPLSAADSTHLMELGRNYTRWLLTGRADSLVAVMTPEFLESSGGAAGVAERLGQVAERAGQETKMVAEKMTRRNGKPQFWHEGEFALYDSEPLVFRFVFDEKGKLAGIGMGPKSQAPSDQ